MHVWSGDDDMVALNYKPSVHLSIPVYDINELWTDGNIERYAHQ